jgi:general secretion pathway protein K
MRSAPKSETGIALFLVLWVLMLLAVIAGEFCYAMRAEVNTTRNFKEETQAYYIAGAGIRQAIVELVKQDILPEKDKTVEVEEKEEEEERIEWRVNAEIPAVEFGAGRFEVRIDNESGKLDINSATGPVLRMIMNAFDLEENEKDIIVDSILDWRDEDDLHRMNGAEDDYYGSLENPYKCKDGDFEAVDELLLVRGVTSELFYGGLRDLVTVYPALVPGAGGFGPSTKARRSLGRININAASPGMLRALPEMTAETVERVLEYRRKEDIRGSTELAVIIGADVYAAISRFITFRSGPYYEIRSRGRLNDSRTQRAVKVLVLIDKRLKKGYRILEWVDAVEYAVQNRVKGAFPSSEKAG